MKKETIRMILNWKVTLSIFTWTIWQAATTFQTSYLRMGEAFRDFGLSIKFFFCLLLGIPNYTAPTVNNFSDVMPWRLIPEEWQALWSRVTDYMAALVDQSNLQAYTNAIVSKLEVVAKAGLVLLPCALILYVAIKRLYRSGNTDHNKDTVPLTVFKKLSQVSYQPIKRFVIGYVEFIRARMGLFVILALVWACNLNLATIVVEFFAYYFYFAVSYRIDTLYIQHTPRQQFISMACGCTVYHTITAAWSTDPRVDSVSIINASVEAAAQDNLCIYLHE